MNSLIEEYIKVCKGLEPVWCAGKLGMRTIDKPHTIRDAPDYLTDDAELGRMVKALHAAVQMREMAELVLHAAAELGQSTLQEAFARACIALKLEVKDE